MKRFVRALLVALRIWAEAWKRKRDSFLFFEMFGFFPAEMSSFPARRFMESRFFEITRRVHIERKLLMEGNLSHARLLRSAECVREFDSAIELAQRFGYSTKLLDEYIEEIKTIERSDPSGKVRSINR